MKVKDVTQCSKFEGTKIVSTPDVIWELLYADWFRFKLHRFCSKQDFGYVSTDKLLQKGAGWNAYCETILVIYAKKFLF